MYALHPDPLITNSRNSLTAKVKEINEFHTEQFVKSLVGLFVSDLENGQYSAFYYREYGLTGYCIDNQLRLKFRDGEGDKVIENKHRIALAECMGQVVPVALFKDFSEEESGNNERIQKGERSSETCSGWHLGGGFILHLSHK